MKKPLDRKRITQSRELTALALTLFVVGDAFLLGFVYMIYKKDIVPDRYYFPVAMILLWINLLLLILIVAGAIKKGRVLPVIASLLCCCLIGVSCFGTLTVQKAYESLNEITEPEEEKKNYQYMCIYVLKDSRAETVNDIASMGIRAYIDTENTDIGITMLKQQLAEIELPEGKERRTITDSKYFKKYYDYIDMATALEDGAVEAILLNPAFMSFILEDDDDFDRKVRVLAEYKWEIEPEETMQGAEVTKEAFVIYISGIDTRSGSLNANCNSDVNILVVVNPIYKKILLVNTPRDYYVPFDGDTEKMDKLSTAGVYGPEYSARTLAKFYGIDINYYVKVNFQTVVAVIDALGGVTVSSDYNFTSKHSLSGEVYDFVKGENKLTGDSALAFVRERKSLPGGDNTRGKHQQKVITAVIKKCTSKDVIIHYADILSVIRKYIKTNISDTDINALIKMQLTDMASWTIESIQATGTGGYGICWLRNAERYITRPSEKSVRSVKNKIREAMVTVEDAEGVFID
ncbi:MAG: LCP family protein [Erysipelotrichaceae bacterium]|nr:LCP family protein [Erysipelotrichaceae bacterium]